MTALVIARIAAPPARGWLSIGPCPGRTDEGRTLAADLAAIRASGADTLITLTEPAELDHLGVSAIGQRAAEAGLIWHSLPIRDFSVPDAQWIAAWQQIGPTVRATLRASGGVHLHCRGGCGRSGMIAALILAELGLPAEEAIAHVRAARACAIETDAQAQFVRAVRAVA